MYPGLRMETVLLFATTVVRGIIAFATPNQQSIGAENAYDHISQELFDDFDELSRIVDIAYCVGTLNTGIGLPFECASYCKDFPSFELVEAWNTGMTLSDSCGFVALSHPPAKPRIIVAFRGTYSITNALADLTVVQQEYIPYPSKGHSTMNEKCEGCMVHTGFFQSWRQAEKIIGPVIDDLVQRFPDYDLELVGHSLGGAVATLAGLDFRGRGWDPRVTTFGEPRIGNTELATFINRKFTEAAFRRVTHVHDPVTKVPTTAMGYEAHEHEYFISAHDLPFTPEDVHLCVGNEDSSCSAGTSLKILELLWAHRDYFHRMGLCIAPDSFLHRIGFLEYDQDPTGFTRWREDIDNVGQALNLTDVHMLTSEL